MSRIIGGPPSMITNGLVGYFDCSNPRSYSVGSTTWKDLMGNYNIGLTGSNGMLPTYWIGDREVIPSIATLPYNGFSFSNDFSNSLWEKNRTNYTSTLISNVAPAPPGFTGFASKLNETTVNSRHALRRGINLAIGEAMTFSFYAKAAERSWVYWENSDWTASAVSFNLATGQIGTINSSGTINTISTVPFNTSIQSVGDGWYRCSLSCRTAYDSISTTIAVAQSDTVRSYAGSTTSGVLIYGAQVEYGSVLKPYIDQPNIISAYENNGYLEYDSPYIQENNIFSLFIWAKGLINGSSFGRSNVFSKYESISDSVGNGITLNVATDFTSLSTNNTVLRSVNLLNIFNTSRPITNHGWFQIGIVRTATQNKFYWNGVLISTQSKDVATTTSAKVKFGSGSGSGSSAAWQSYPGLGFGTIQVYNRELSDSEVSQNYQVLRTRYRNLSTTQFGRRTIFENIN